MRNPLERNQKHSIKSNDIKRSILLGLLLGMGIALVFTAGFFFREIVGLPSRVSASASDDESYPLLDEVQALLNRHFVREQPDYTARQYAAVRGMLSSLEDPYTFFIDPPVAASESDVLAGTYGGIGVQIQRSESGELILFPFDDSPALEAGIEAGDILREINGQPVDVTLPQDSIDQMLRGEVRDGNGVEITVDKVDSGESFTTFVPFAVINVPSIVWRVLQEDPQIGYVQIMRFTSRTPEELTTAVEELRNSEIRALVLDLRGNTGGLLQESIMVADEFIPSGVIVYERDSNGEEAHHANGGGVAVDLPLAVLVNDRTASGAELVAGAIQDLGRGILIGGTTYGKGTVQQIFPLSDGSSLHVTSSEWFTPNHQPLDQSGLQPDIVVEPDPNGLDVDLGEAIRHLQAQLETENEGA
ncbi:MAG TPA: S41 family peptidase [Oceanobacillus sp.]|nr:S41 family peptidase [Oceanobacillus sp.]